MTSVVGFTGVAESGKSIAAKTLEEIGYKRIRFSDPMKNMLREFFRAYDMSDEEIERRIEGDLKEEPDPYLCGKTPRYAMQMLGKEWGRDLIGDTIWTNVWRKKAETELAAGNKIVAEDVRFATEDFEIRRLEGSIVEIFGRKKSSNNPTHESEMFEGVNPDFQIKNTGTIADLRGAVIYIFREPTDEEVAA